MLPRGIDAFEKRDEKKTAVYAYENRPRELSNEFEKEFRKRKKAWDFFQKQPPWYQRVATHYVLSAKQEKTRISRLEKLILASEAGERL